MPIEAPCFEVELTISAKNLKDRDYLSKSDPMCVISLMDGVRNSRFCEIGRTEKLQNTLNPEWSFKPRINYFFEESQKLKFEIFDVDKPSLQLSDHDYLGCMEVTLGELVGAPGNKVHRQLTGLHGNCGSIIVSTEEVNVCKEVLYLQLKGVKLDKKDLFGKSDPFLLFYRKNDDGSRQLACRTEVIKNTLNPEWKPFEISLRQLCYGQKDRPFEIECFDYDNDGGHDLIGTCTTTVEKLLKQGSQPLLLINQKKQQKKKSYTDSGQLIVVRSQLKLEHSFLDYIRGGTQIHFTVAIDFTASNGNPRDPRSLHHMNPHQPNQYQIALRAVGDICQDYNTTKLFPALGFGAKIPPKGEVSHEFFLNFHPSDPRCNGVDGILHAYANAIQQSTLYGPTNFSPVITHVARIAAGAQDGSNYFILLIITDGIITDMEKTKAAIVAASGLPMSIIIVGVGGEDFAAMEELDADKGKLSSNGHYAKRDIVQFVPLRNFLSVAGAQGGDWVTSQARLAKEVLAEVPAQLTGWMKSRDVQPRPPVQVGDIELQMQPPPPPPQSVPLYPSGSYPPPNASSPRPGEQYPTPPYSSGPYPPPNVSTPRPGEQHPAPPYPTASPYSQPPVAPQYGASSPYPPQQGFANQQAPYPQQQAFAPPYSTNGAPPYAANGPPSYAANGPPPYATNTAPPYVGNVAPPYAANVAAPPYPNP